MIEKDRAYLWHPFTQMKAANYLIPIVKAKGLYLYGEDGKTYLPYVTLAATIGFFIAFIVHLKHHKAITKKV